MTSNIYITNLVKPWLHIRTKLTIADTLDFCDDKFEPGYYGYGSWNHYSIGYYSDDGYVELFGVEPLSRKEYCGTYRRNGSQNF